MADVICTNCNWSGDSSETVSDVEEDSDGDMTGQYSFACPECLSPTVDADQGIDGFGDL